MRRPILLAALVSAFVLGPMTGPGQAASATTLLGNSSIESSRDSDAAGSAEAFAYTAVASGSAASISVYVDSSSSAKGLVVGLYTDNGGQPDRLLASGGSSAPTAGQWNQVNLGSTPSVASGGTYWIAIMGTGGTLSFRDLDPRTGVCSQTSSQTNLTSLPSAWTPGSSWTTCSLSAYVNAATAPAPANTAPPTISGQTVQGQTLTASDGTWTNLPSSYAYSWQVCDPLGANCSNIAGATSASYALALGDVGHTVRVVVTATNAGGSASAASNQTVVIAARPVVSAPSSTAPPAISGPAVQGQTLTVSNGTWVGTAPISYAYQWQEDGVSDISGATGQTYTPAASDVGHTLNAVVRATNSVGSASASSGATGVVSSSGGGGGGVSFKPIDGGSSYFANISRASAWMDGHVLLGAWLEQPTTAADVGYDAAMGDNIYWNLAGSPTDPFNLRADYNVIRAGGMHVSAPDTTASTGSETVAMDGNDESDMNFGPGWNGYKNNGVWNNSACIPGGSACGYTVDSQYYNSINGAYAVHQGYGKGVLFWQTDPQAAKFLTFSDIESADSYWMTDTDLQVPSQGGCALLPNDPLACNGGSGSGLTYAQAHLPANYAYDVTQLEKLQAMNGSSKPVVVDVETGCPFSGGNNVGHCTTPPAMVASAWHALIAGARGIIWFQHNFSGPCVDLRTLIDGSDSSSSMYNCQQTPGITLHNMVQALTAFNQEVASLNGVLLSPTAVGYVSTTGDVSTSAKAYGGSCYVFAGSGKPATPPPANQAVTFTLADRYTGRVTVIDENRTLQASNGTLYDTFADANAIHIYQLNGSTCG